MSADDCTLAQLVDLQRQMLTELRAIRRELTRRRAHARLADALHAWFGDAAFSAANAVGDAELGTADVADLAAAIAGMTETEIGAALRDMRTDPPDGYTLAREKTRTGAAAWRLHRV